MLQAADEVNRSLFSRTVKLPVKIVSQFSAPRLCGGSADARSDWLTLLRHIQLQAEGGK